MTQITRLEVSNVKKLRAVTIDPDGSLVIVAGDNGAGKSSVLDSIMYALAGGRAIPDEPLRKGARRGKIVLHLDNGITVERTFKKGGSSLKVFVDDEDASTSTLARGPQKLLDDLYGQMSFDPLAFTRLSATARLEMLQGMVSADVRELLDKLEKKARDAFEERTGVNREIKRLEALNLGNEREDTSTIDTAELAGELIAIDELQAAGVEVDQRLSQVVARCSDRDGEIARIEAVVTKAREEMSQADGMLKTLWKRQEEDAELAHEVRENLAAARLAVPDKGPLLEQLAQAGQKNSIAAAAKDRNKNRALLFEWESQSEKLSGVIQGANEAREEALAEAALPIEGLTFDDGGVRVDGQPWDQASGAEQLRVSAAMGMALNPELKVLLIRDGSLLDETSLRMLSELAEDAGAQVWLEMVGDRKDATVVLEDGHVRGEVYSHGEAGEREPHEQRDNRSRDEEGIDGATVHRALGSQDEILEYLERGEEVER